MDALTWFIAWLAFTALIGWWAKEWGRDWLMWGALALFLSPIIAGIALAVLGQEESSNIEARGLRKCPFCAELIRAEAIKCKHCGSNITATKGAEYLDEKALNDLIAKLQKENQP